MGGKDGATRLDGLLNLLDSGSNPSVRKMAASQIGDLVAAHPSETKPVLKRVRRLLKSRNWETRIAASQAIAAISEQSPRFTPTWQENGTNSDPSQTEVKKKQEVLEIAKAENVLQSLDTTAPSSDAKPAYTGLRFETLDIIRVMKSGAMLFGSAGDEYKDMETDIAKQRASLKADLGLDDRYSQGDVLGLKDEDLVQAKLQKSNGGPSVNLEATANVVDDMAELGLSARERNRRKREAKKRARMGTDSGRSSKRPRVTPNSSEGNPQAFSLKAITAPEDDEEEDFEREFGDGYWDFQSTCEVLKSGLLEVRWEWRHGAAIGLRQILMKHASSAGRSSPGERGDEENELWLEDLCCRLLCVLAMDRFGDFVGDAVVAPVREAAAMTLGAAARAMSPNLSRSLMKRIFFLLNADANKNWEVRHSALLGARYVLAVKNDMAEELLRLSFGSVMQGLKDADDDVRAVAAEALFPVASRLISFMPHHVSGLVTVLWDGLLDLDDISASTSSVLRLLSEITSHPAHADSNVLWLDPSALKEGDMSDDEAPTVDVGSPSANHNIIPVLIEIVPRLFAFLRHNSKIVRRASVKLLETVTLAFDEDELVSWVTPILADVTSRIFRNLLFEVELDTLQVSKSVWHRVLCAFGKREGSAHILVQSVRPLLHTWTEVASQETRTEALSIDEDKNRPKLTRAQKRRRAAAARRAAKSKKTGAVEGVIPRTEHDGDTATPAEGPFDGVLMQQSAAAAIGSMAVYWLSGESSLERQIGESLRSQFAAKRRLACDICASWATHTNSDDFVFPESIRVALQNEITGSGECPFAEVGHSVGSFFTDSNAFLQTVGDNILAKVTDPSGMKNACSNGKQVLTARNARDAALYARTLRPHMSNLVTGDVWEYISASLHGTGMKKRRFEALQALRMRILASIGYISTREEEAKIALASSATAAVVASLGTPLPPKVAPFIKALMAALKNSKNPHIQSQAAGALSHLALRLSARKADKPLSLMLKNLMKYLTAEQQVSDKKIVASMAAKGDLELDQPAIAKRGALGALEKLCSRFDESLFEKLPWLWNRIQSAFTRVDHMTAPTQEVNQAMIVLRAIVAHVSKALHSQVGSLIPFIITVCAAPHSVYSKHSPKCLADVVAAMPGPGMYNVISKLVPLLSGSHQDKDSDASSRRGVAKALREVVDRMGHSLIPYAAFMVVPMMTRMVDEDEVVREAAAGVFGTLVRLMPLEGGAPDDPAMSESMAEERKEARSFLGQLLGTEPRSHYHLPVQIGDGITLRKYQQDCLDWLAFLNRYELHGALCDDMGLGKTLMTLCMITGDSVTLREKGNPMPSLVICPSTIVAHWVQEAERFFGHALPAILQYAGSPKRRRRFRNSSILSAASLVVTSYDILANDLQYFESIRWNYVVLDEGHVIKNPKTRVARAVRSLSARHRLILTGTPIQNSVIELWAMFDFLMPGFLGNEKSFKESYAKPIMASRDGKCSEADQEKGMVATEALHRQVLPFVLRRLKDDVLSELPPKIVQDYYCNMTPLQMRLYEDFASEFKSNNDGDSGNEKQGGTHVFTALSYMRRLCSHPKLVLTPEHPEYESVHTYLRKQKKSIDDIQSSAKLVGLMSILRECGIGGGQTVDRGSGGHRALIFAQLKDMLDLVENDLFRVHMPGVTYLRLDGSVEATKRQPIVTRFNADPTIDCLLLTTHVGGLGLNLTGADTVIFLEHDWNPTKDLQAMDRAHRMGQKRTVNVYRLITRGTLEEKIMSIQRFKTHIANTVVNRDNSNLQSMNTEQLLDLFKVEEEAGNGADSSHDDVALGTGKGLKAALSGLGELWEEKQYEDEYNMEDFLAGMQ